MSIRAAIALFVVLVVTTSHSAQAALPLMVTDSGTGDRVMLFDGHNGALIDLNWITDIAAPFVFTTPKEAAVVGNEIWVSDQVVDAVHRFDLNRNFLGSITHDHLGNTLDNIRGFGYDGSRVYLTRFHGTNTLRGIVTIDPATATASDFFPTGTQSLFDAQPFGVDLLISNSSTSNIERWSTSGTFLGNFATGLPTPQQVSRMDDGSIIAVSTIAAAGIEGVYHYNADGTLRRFIDTEILKGAWELGDGDYLVTTSVGVFKYHVTTNSFSPLATGVNAQYVNPFIPEPACLGLLSGLAVLALRRRN
jgi:DNA-binding beta-propeller fold protein YncE